MNMQTKRDAGAVKRYHAVRLIGQQTVSEHTFNMMLIMLEIEPNPSVNLVKAVMYHDLAELFTGDIPATFKWEHPEIGKALAVAEENILDSGGMLVELTEREQLIVKFADMMELLLFCDEQITMGNLFVEQAMTRGLNYLLAMPPFSDVATKMLTDYQLKLLGDNNA